LGLEIFFVGFLPPPVFSIGVGIGAILFDTELGVINNLAVLATVLNAEVVAVLIAEGVGVLNAEVVAVLIAEGGGVLNAEVVAVLIAEGGGVGSGYTLAYPETTPPTNTFFGFLLTVFLRKLPPVLLYCRES
jgi:hypothetical protein